MVLNEEPIYFEHSRGNRYEVFFETPDTKEYDELKLIFACHNDEIAVISVMPIILRHGALKVGIPIPHLLFGSACFRIQLSERLSRCAIRL